jgi:hypothetical protein
MIQIRMNGLKTRTFDTWDEVMGFFDEILGHYPKGKMRKSILKGESVQIGSNTYSAEVEAAELAYA